MSHRILGNYVRVHRKKAGLSQRELARLLGYNREFQISRHEQSHTVPPLLVALAYQEVFQVPISAIFTGIHQTVAQIVVRNKAELEKELLDSKATGRSVEKIAQKLKWLQETRRVA